MTKLIAVLFVLAFALPAPAGDDVLDLYDVRDLAKGENRPAADIGKLVEDNIEGIASLEVRSGSVLVVKAPAAVHGKIRQFLADLRASQRDVLRVFPIEDLVTRGHSPEGLAKRVRKAAPDAKVMVHKGSRLIVAAPPDDQEKIEEILAELRRKGQPLVTIETSFLRGGETAGGARYLTEIELAELLRAVSKDPRTTVVAAPRITCFNAQRANLAIGSERSYVKDFTVEFGEGDALVVNPVIDTIFEGLDVTVRPILSVDRKYVTLVIDAKVRKLLEPELSTAPKKPGRVGMDLLEVRELRRLTSVTLPDGHAVLLDLGTIPVDGREEAVKLLIRATTVMLEETEPK